MNDIFGYSQDPAESVLVMPPTSMKCLELFGESIVCQFQPSALECAQPIDIADWIDRLLPPFGVHVMPAGGQELCGRAAVTYPTGDFECEILVLEYIWREIPTDPKAYFARATVMHEIAHAILHVPVIRRLKDAPEREFALTRVERAAVPAFSDPEWQAWALAGAILMPRRTVLQLADFSPANLAAVYQVSERFAAVRLKRLKIDPVAPEAAVPGDSPNDSRAA